ncbi:MAG: beta-N-acetylhexosaminidase [Methyloligellaceae bacterium]
MALKAFVSGCASTTLDEDERAFFRSARPCGLILFQRNCESPEQLRRLVDDVREAVGSGSFLVLIDQEGGRVRRLRPPAWRDYPSARAIGGLFRENRQEGLEAAWLCARRQADDLREAHITMNCAPVLDIPVPGAHDIIGDRAYGEDAESVAALGARVAQGYLAGSVTPVIKHIPGHGRARADSHEALPIIDVSAKVLEESDFRPFAALSGLPAAMTGHLLLTAFDRARPVSVSPSIIKEVIRERIGFGGLLMSDDVSMKALAGSLGERAAGALRAGCDIALHCNGRLREMEEVAAAVPELSGKALERFEAACSAAAERPEPYDRERAEALLDRLVALEQRQGA